jgi:hypothetical protein
MVVKLRLAQLGVIPDEFAILISVIMLSFAQLTTSILRIILLNAILLGVSFLFLGSCLTLFS